MATLGGPFAQFGPLLGKTERQIQRVLRQIWTQLAPDLPEVVRKPDFGSIRCSDMGIFCLTSLKKEPILARQPEARFNLAKSPLAGVANCFQGRRHEAEAFEISHFYTFDLRCTMAS